MLLQETLQMERKWEQNADCVKLLANSGKRLIIMANTEYPNLVITEVCNYMFAKL